MKPMLEFFYIMAVWPIQQGIHDITLGDWSGALLITIGILMDTLIVGVIAAILFVIYDIIDKSGPTTTHVGTVTQTRFVPAHVTTIYNVATKTQTPIFHPPRWHAAFQANETIEELGVSEKLYAQLHKDDQMRILITQGKLSKRTRIVGFAP
jgi:hypothetical protein